MVEQELTPRDVPSGDRAMTPYGQQVALEAWMRRVGGSRATGKGWEKGAGSFMAYRMIGPYLSTVLDYYERGKVHAGRQGMIWELLGNESNVKQVALECLFAVFGSVGTSTRYNKLCHSLGKRAEYVLWLNHPEMKGDHLEGLRLASNNDLGMKAMESRLKDKGFRKLKFYRRLTTVERTALGAFFIEAMAASTQMFDIEIHSSTGGRRFKAVVPTQLYWDFLGRWKQNLMMYRPAYMPLIIPPKPYRAHDDGGYYSIVTGCMKVPWERFPEAMAHANDAVLGSLNKLQSEPMRIEPDQINLVRDLWEIGIGVGDLPPRERAEYVNFELELLKLRDKSAVWRKIWKVKRDRAKDGERAKVVNLLASYEQIEGHDELYWAWQMDSRGRLYQRGSQINYQGGDVYRSMLTFTEGPRLLDYEREFAWAMGDAWGCAPCWTERHNHLMSRRQLIAAIGESPIDHVAQWELAKHPFRYVSLCREWARAMKDSDYRTPAVFQLDQTTSGYGHLACLLRNRELAANTNVIGCEHRDLYTIMAESIHRIAFDEYGKMVEADSDKAKLLEWWLNNWPGRKLFKPAIMPYIYGRKYLSLQHLITEQLIQQFQHSQSEEGHQSVSLGHSLARVIHLGVKRTMPDLLRLSDWLSAGAARMIQQGLEPSWHTPNGLKIRSYTSVTRKCRMLLVLSGKKVSIQIKDNEDAPLDTTTSHVTADFIHSMDAAFLQHFVHQWDGPIVAVHDCFGTTLDRVHVLRDDLAEQFQKFYQSCHLMNHYRYLAEHGIDVGLPPMVNTLDVEQIGDNPFLFT